MTKEEETVAFFVGLNQAVESAKRYGIEVKALAAEAYLRGFNAGFDTAKGRHGNQGEEKDDEDSEEDDRGGKEDA